MKDLFNVLERSCVTAWRRTFERPQSLRVVLNKLTLVASGLLTTETSIIAFVMAKRMWKIGRQSGLLFLALYLKQCSSCLQNVSGGVKRRPEPLPVFVRLTRWGCPAIIPSYHRNIIKRGDDRSDKLVKLYLSWFSLSKMILLVKPVDSSVFKSITDEVKDTSRILDVCGRLEKAFDVIKERYIPWVSTIPVEQGIRWIPTWTSTPNSMSSLFGPATLETGVVLKKWTSIFTAYFYELAAYGELHQLAHATPQLWSSGCLWRSRTRFALDPDNQVQTKTDLDHFQRWIGPWLPTPKVVTTHRRSATLKDGSTITIIGKLPPFRKGSGIKFGKLASATVGAGKRRVFAIGNYVNQRLLRPYHDWMMLILKRIPNDGTFAQERPLDFVKGAKDVYSFDLKSATDRWPLTILYTLFAQFFGGFLASSVVQTTLGYNTFVVEPPFTKKRSAVCFVAGQPLGYFCSWPLFALSHHWMVWLAAHVVYPYKKFKAYAILGDDVVIADSGVAREYSRILDDLGVTISLQKSLISSTGAFEFAKKFYLKGRVDCSPISARAILMNQTPLGLALLANKYNLSNRIVLRLGGAGYRVLCHLQGSLNRRWTRILKVVSKPHDKDPQAFERWLGNGTIPKLNPYLKGVIYQKMVDKLRPKDLKPPPEELFHAGDHLEIVERTVMRAWMDQWLSYLKWYSVIVMKGDCELLELFEAPMVETLWYRNDGQIKELVRYGYLWKILDLIQRLGHNWRPPLLEPLSVMHSSRPRYIPGGWDGTAFLLSVEGLITL